MITDIVSSMNINQTIMRINTVFVKRAISHKFAPSASDPTSHIKNLAGLILNQRKATKAPHIETHSVERRNNHWSYVMNQYTPYVNNNNHPASPSRPSVKFTLFAAAIIININSGIKRSQSSMPGNIGSDNSISDQPSLS